MSTTYIANLAQIIGWFLTLVGANIGLSDLQITISTIIMIVSSIMVFISRWRAGGITILGFRK